VLVNGGRAVDFDIDLLRANAVSLTLPCYSSELPRGKGLAQRGVSIEGKEC
jgi:hypothetical protein